MIYKRLVCVLLFVTAVFSLPLSAGGVSHDDALQTLSAGTLSAESWVLYCPDNGTVIRSYNMDKQMAMASTTKIMTALLIIENCDLNDIITVPASACGVEGSSIYLYEKERITVRDILYAIMLESANDAATAGAIHCGGDVDSFVAMMNDRAEKIGMENTSFKNPHGLPQNGHYSSARDMAILMECAMNEPVFADITGTYKYTSPMTGSSENRVFINHNKLLKNCDGIVGGKTGFTKESGRCLVTMSERNGISLIAVTLNAPDDWRDHQSLYDAGFSTYERHCFAAKGAYRYELPVVSGVCDSVTVTADSIDLIIKRDDKSDYSIKHELPPFCYASVSEGEILGRLVLYRDNEIVASSYIKADNNVEAVKYKNIFQRIISIFKKE